MMLNEEPILYEIEIGLRDMKVKLYACLPGAHPRDPVVTFSRVFQPGVWKYFSVKAIQGKIAIDSADGPDVEVNQ